MTSPRLLLACSIAVALSASGCQDPELVGARFVGAPTTSAPADEDYEYQSLISAVQPPAAYTLVTAPAGMTVDADGMVTWTPGFADLGLHPVRLEGTDGENLAVLEWEVNCHQDVNCGLTYSPEGHVSSITPETDEAFFVESFDYGRVVGFRTNWRDSLLEAGEIPDGGLFAQERRTQYGIFPLITFSWADEAGVPDLLSEADMVDNSWSNQETRDEFRMMVAAYAGQYAPPYICLGHEVNTWFLANTADYADWLTQLEESYDAIKAASPNTKVFVSFQLERLKGLGSGTIGWMDAPQWNLIDDLEAGDFADAVAFTTYPYLEFATPAAVPADYYDEIATHWSGEVIFTEAGWPAVANAPYPGDPTQQSDFVGVLFERLEGVDSEVLLWLYLHDLDNQAAFPQFQEMGFRSNDGMTVRPADAVWQTAVDLRERP